MIASKTKHVALVTYRPQTNTIVENNKLYTCCKLLRPAMIQMKSLNLNITFYEIVTFPFQTIQRTCCIFKYKIILTVHYWLS